MSNVLAAFIATLITFPFLCWYLIYIITVKITKYKSRSVRLASDVSFIFFVSAIYFISYDLWQRSFLWLIFIIIFFIAICFTFVHFKIAEDIHIIRLLRGIWRFNFILFFIVYIILSSYGIFSRIFT